MNNTRFSISEQLGRDDFADVDRLLALLDEPASEPVPAPADEPVVLDLGDFRFSACVDTIQLDIVLREPSRVHSTKDEIASALGVRPEKVWTRWAGADAGGNSQRWSITVQNPTMARLDAVEATLETRWGLAETIRVGFIDLAVDARKRGLDKRRTGSVVNRFSDYERLLRLIRDRLWIHPHDRNLIENGDRIWRTGSSDKSSATPNQIIAFTRQMQANFFNRSSDPFSESHGYYVGGRKTLDDAGREIIPDIPAWKIYWKTIDDGLKPIAPIDRRARLECRLSRAALIATGFGEIEFLENLRGFRFAGLAGEFFTFRHSAFASVPICHQPQILAPGKLASRADSVLNKALFRALQRLSTSWMAK